MLLREFCSHFRVVRFALGRAQVRFNVYARVLNAGGHLSGGPRRRLRVVTLRVNPRVNPCSRIGLQPWPIQSTPPKFSPGPTNPCAPH